MNFLNTPVDTHEIANCIEVEHKSIVDSFMWKIIDCELKEGTLFYSNAGEDLKTADHVMRQIHLDCDVSTVFPSVKKMFLSMNQENDFGCEEDGFRFE